MENNHLEDDINLLQNQKYFLLYGGQGAPYLNELKQLYYTNQKFDTFFEKTFDTLSKVFDQLPKNKVHSIYKYGLDVKHWLENPDSVPSNSYLQDSMVSVPVMFVVQAGNYLRFVERLGGFAKINQNIIGSTGHSLGIFPSVLSSVSVNEESFYDNYQTLLKTVFLLGYYSKVCFPDLELHPSSTGKYTSKEKPSPMASVSKISFEKIQSMVEQFNKEKETDLDKVFIGLRNTEKVLVLSGSTERLLDFRSQFDLKDKMGFLAVGSPFHSPLMKPVISMIENSLKDDFSKIKGENLQFPVYDTRDGSNLQEKAKVLKEILDMAVWETVVWKNALSSLMKTKSQTIVLSFGAGDLVDKMSSNYLRANPFIFQNLTTQERLDTFVATEQFTFPRKWEDYQPKLVELPNKKKFLLNKFSLFTKKSPFFGGGMTPTTVETDIVVAAANEGFIVEWAGGGQVTEEMFFSRLDQIKKDIKTGASIVFNMLFLDAYLWNLQYPLVKKAKQMGYPIDGVTISAGIPDVKDAVHILNELEEAGLWLNAFKPGTAAQIRQVIKIAKELPNQNIVMHIEGGAAGGHHSWENLQSLILESYAKIREVDNLILTVGGGVATPEQATSWLLGTWNKEVCMPVDGVFLGTRLMAAKESKTSDKIKQDLVQLSGGSDWTDTKDGKDVGGIVSGRSGLGADIYYANTHWSKLSEYAESLVKGKDDKDALESILKHKAELVDRINQTTKPYFGDLESMTYKEVLERLVYLFAPGKRLELNEGKWLDEPFVDSSYRNRLAKIIWRFEGRVCNKEQSDINSILVEPSDLDDPEAILKKFFAQYSDNINRFLLPEDIIFFKEVCQSPGKPVNFVPFIDENIVKWIRSDSLWYSHCKNVDGDSCAWIPGPVAVSGIKKSNEPVSEILKSFENDTIQSLGVPKNTDYSYFLSQNLKSENNLNDFVQTQESKDLTQITILKEIDSDRKDWIQFLCEKLNINQGLYLLLNSEFINLDKEIRKNDIFVFLTPKLGRSFIVQRDENAQIKSFTVQLNSKNEVIIDIENDIIRFSLVYDYPFETKKSAYFTRKFYITDNINSFIHEKYEEKLQSIKDFYSKIWNIESSSQKIQLDSILKSSFKVEKTSVYDFKKSTNDLYRSDIQNENIEPAKNMAIVYAWQTMMQSLFLDEIKGNIFNLLHLYHKFNWEDSVTNVALGDVLDSEAKIIGISISPKANAKKVQVGGKVFKNKQLICNFETAFLIRGDFKDDSLTLYEFEGQKKYSIQVTKQSQKNFLTQLEWLKIDQQSVQVGDTLDFDLEEKYYKKTKTSKDSFAKGNIFKNQKNIGNFLFKSQDKRIKQNPFDALISLFESTQTQHKIENPYCAFSDSFYAPDSMDLYSVSSTDFNPIHTNTNFALLAGLEQPIVHGMWTSSQALNFCNKNLLKGNSDKIDSLVSNFEKPVLCGEKLYINAYHNFMSNGKLGFNIEILNSKNERVYSGDLTIKSPNTAYIFTGQGSQSQGMGMSFYDSYPEAKVIWDRAEAMTQKLGFSIMKIVRDNPTSYAMEGQVWQHPKGVLNLTQFTQVGLVTKSLADWEVLKKRAILTNNSVFAGHSLGEFSALACTGIISIEEVVQIVYKRGLAMQHFVPRDENGKSPFGMSVILGNRHVGLNESKILEIVEEVKQETKLHLEVVNYNIKDKQYSVTGYLEALEKMEQKLKVLLKGKRTFIRLAGIDVPFHSSLLIDGVENFRLSLEEKIHEKIDFSILDNRYIPNLVAVPFSIKKDFVELVYKVSKSKILENILKNYDKETKNPNSLRRVLLIELLSFQFAKPVQWIKTQDYFIDSFDVERVIDIGARGDLAGMMRQTIRELPNIDASILHIEENKSQVFYELEGVEKLSITEEKKTKKVEEKSSVVKDKKVSAPVMTQVAPEPVTVSQNLSQEELADVALSQTDSLKYILALKAEIRVDEIKDTDTIDQIFGGNSSKRNQVLADIGTEFNTTSLDGAQDKSISDLSKILSTITYKKPGPYLKVAFEEFIKSYMPSDFSRKDILAHLKDERMLPDGHLFSVCSLIPVLSRSGDSNLNGKLSDIGLEKRLSNASESKKWIDKAVDLYGKQIGTSIPHKSQGGAGVSQQGALVDNVALEALEQKYFGIDGAFYKILQFSKNALHGLDPYSELIHKEEEFIEERRQLQIFQKEHGKSYSRILNSHFDENKVVSFENSLQWAKKNIIQSYWNLKNGKTHKIESKITRQIINHPHEDVLSLIEFYLENEDSKSIISEFSELKKAINQKEKKQFYPIENPKKCSVSISDFGSIEYKEVQEENYSHFLKNLKTFFSIHSTQDQGLTFLSNEKINNKIEELANHSVKKGLSFSEKVALVTGAGQGSIAIEIVKNLLAAGMKVVVTTSSYSDKRLNFYKKVFQEYSSLGSSLIIVPFSQGSSEDIKNLCSYLIKEDIIPDLVLPFGAVGEENTVSTLSDESLSSLKVMLFGVEKLIGELSKQFTQNQIIHKQFSVILPLSPNHGIFGRDGMYAETKIGLEALLKKWYSENDDWGKFCKIVGARIGWVRGTGLMEMNNIVAPDLENNLNIKTFSQVEMGLLLTLLYAYQSEKESEKVILADLTGGLGSNGRLKEELSSIRKNLLEKAEIVRDSVQFKSNFSSLVYENEIIPEKVNILSRSFYKYPEIPSNELLESFGNLQDLDLSKVICIVGYGEVGPCGNSLSRWEIEKDGVLSIEGAIELAWMTGLIEYQKVDSGYSWVDCETGEAILDWEVKSKYEEKLLSCSGIRILKNSNAGFDPSNIPSYTDVLLEEDFVSGVNSKEEALEFKKAEPEATEVYYDDKKEKWFIKRKKGSVIKVLRSIRLERNIGGVVPDGWDPKKYGVSKDLIQQVDPITVFNIISTCEAFLSAGMEPFELYKYLHPREVGTTVGSGMGGMLKLKNMYTDYLLDNKRQNDVLQEALINVNSSWVISSLLGSIGPIQSPVAACATGGLSLDMGVNLMNSGKAKFLLTGAFDDMNTEGYIGFGDMNATANTDSMSEKGIQPHRVCRPNDKRRGGFVEAQGGGVIMIATGDLVLQMGLPVYGIVAYTSTHSDGIHASIPAPGLGIASVGAKSDNLLEEELRNYLSGDLTSNQNDTLAEILDFKKKIKSKIDSEKFDTLFEDKDITEKIKRILLSHINQDFYQNDRRLSPLEAALSVYGLKADDIMLVYKHDTSTQANDFNENKLHHTIQSKIGRKKANPLMVVSQKRLTGHSKGGAAVFQAIGLLQTMEEGKITGNINLEDIDKKMNEFSTMCFTDETIEIGKHRIKAGLITSLGFGHVGMLGLLLHSNFYLSCLNEKQREDYLQKRKSREKYTLYRSNEVKTNSEKPLYERKIKPPFDSSEELDIFTDSSRRMKNSKTY